MFYQNQKTMTKIIKGGRKIEFTGYRSALKHRNALKELLVSKGGIVDDLNNSTTGSYYLVVDMPNEKYFEIRCSNHTKPDADANDVIVESTWGNGIDVNITSTEGYKSVVAYINDNF